MEQLFEVNNDPKIAKIFRFAYKFLKFENISNITKNNLNLLGYCFNKQFVSNQTLKPKKMVVTIMGHVDHGKTTLLDYLRQTQVACSEVGGITQRIAGFTMTTHHGDISFIDTPGHHLFSNMRKTGASVTDYIVLIVSAVEGVQSQTLEIIDLIKENKVPYMVALNKVDRLEVDIERAEE